MLSLGLINKEIGFSPPETSETVAFVPHIEQASDETDNVPLSLAIIVLLSILTSILVPFSVGPSYSNGFTV